MIRQEKGRLALIAAALVIARRDFTAILFSRSFVFFLLGPLFPVIVGALAGSVGSHSETVQSRSVVGVAMSGDATARVIRSHQQLSPYLGDDLPDFIPVAAPDHGKPLDPRALLRRQRGDLSALLSGTLEHPVLTGPSDSLEQWRGQFALIIGQAAQPRRQNLADIRLDKVVSHTKADVHRGQVMTAQAGQTLLFLLTMLLAGMVLSNLVEEKANKIIEILAAAVPMDAVFLGKLFAMLGVSLFGIVVWFVAGSALHLVVGQSLPSLDPPALGWPLFFVLGIVYFALAYLLLGSLFLAIGSMAATVRDVQTMSMPVTMLQLLVFFFASYAMSDTGSTVELLAVVIPFSSPFAMLARAAVSPLIWPHLLAIVWQVLCVGLFVKAGATLFRRKVLHSGPGVAERKPLFARIKDALQG